MFSAGGSRPEEPTMSITAVEPRVQTAGASGAGGAQALGRDDFMNLLVTQLRHQDPLKPMDRTDFTAQLAQFSSLEQLSNLNLKVEELSARQGQAIQTQMLGAIGRVVTAAGDQVTAGGGQGAACQFELQEDAANVLASLFDAGGQLVAVVDGGAQPAGRGSLFWDGRDTNGNPVPAGAYRLEVDAFDAGGRPVTARTLTSAQVTGVAYRDGRAYFLAGDQELPLDHVMTIQSPAATQAGS